MGVDDSPLVSFECVEWHPTDRVRRQFGLQQLPLGLAFDIGRDHCRRLTGPRNHDWRARNIQWVTLWISSRYNTLHIGEEIVDFHPLQVYFDWYTQQYGDHLRLSDRVVGGEADVNEPHGQQEEAAGPQEQNPPYEQQFEVPAYDQGFQVPAYEHDFQVLAYEHQFQMPGYEQHYQDPSHAEQFQMPAYG
ncbi:hypothetical protein Ahy_B01g051690 [Arachis hypogaea]|uniref:Aminotransferase-like plant mobile domain-containing protein n=1 Tax=Arachis hypogaea TaxID=3818 RepID=A0A445AMI9_ARAHY|nr:hypothetical protein Ahy_B01g051690 [Arachis hypogaea]